LTGWSAKLDVVDVRRGAEVRYDTIADWYLAWIDPSAGLLCDPGYGMMPACLDGQRWLEVACGAGRTSRELARRGAEVVGVDLSVKLIAAARAQENISTLAITYCTGDITNPVDWWDGKVFDGAVCEMALMDIDDLEGTLASVARVVRPGGALRVSLVHPCFPGNEAGLSSWPPDRGYHAEGYWRSDQHNPEGVRIRVGSSHRTLATYLNVMIDASFMLERVHEPPTSVPTWLMLAFRRAG
jgi:2-polyprenyl-3-methyl-5-hydroxy-6-metoxy-1,4-benzoquinol methylase